MKNKYVFVTIMLTVILVLSMGFTNIYVSSNQKMAEEDEFIVVTSFYPMYIAAMNVIGNIEDVTLKNLSEPQTGCLHDFQLTPADMKLLSTADVFIINGGGIESFMEEIAEQYPDLQIVEACEGIELLSDEHHEDEHTHEMNAEDVHEEELHNHEVNAHAWMSVSLYRQQIRNIANGLIQADPIHEEVYYKNAGMYDAKLEELQVEQEMLFSLTWEQPAILFHCAYEYLARDMGMDVKFCMDLDEERQISAGEIAEVLEVIAHDNVRYIFAEERYGASMCEMVQRETEDVMTIYLDPLNRGEYDADSYLREMRSNFELIKMAFESVQVETD